MRNFLRAALVIGTLATPLVAMADTPAKDDTSKTADKAPATKDAPKPVTTKKTTVKKVTTKKTTTKAAPKTDTKTEAPAADK
jgi:hypothetical protein